MSNRRPKNSKAKGQNRSYQRAEDKPFAITPYEAECIQEAFDHLRELFDSTLPDAFIRYETKANSDGYYSPNGFSGRSGEFGKDAITLNADRFVGRTDKQILAVLSHNLGHHWQRHCGTEPSRHYHDEQWSAKMESIGLQPSSTGEVGGKVTGQHMSQYIVPGGPFDKACDKLIASGWRLNLQSTPRPGPKVKRDKSKTPFTCASCGQNSWGKPSMDTACRPCLKAAVTEQFGDAAGAIIAVIDANRMRVVIESEAPTVKAASLPLLALLDQSVEGSALSYETASTPAIKRGRPKGSKNKTKLSTQSYEQPSVLKRKPGRPKGSKNKPKPAKPADHVHV